MADPAFRVRFPRDDGFHAELKRRCAEHFAATGGSPFGGRAMQAKTAVIVGWFAASYGLLLALGGASAWLAVPLTASVALAVAGIGFSVMHDANHGAYARSSRVNRFWGLALDFIGASSYVWRHKHNVLHHTFVNVEGVDADIDAGPLIRLARTQRLRAIHRYQHLYAWFLYGLLAVKWWLLDDFVDVIRGRIGRQRFPRPRGRHLMGFLAGKAIFVGWSLVLPVLVHRTAWIGLFFLLGSLLLGMVLSVVFQLAHIVPEAAVHQVLPGRQRMPTGWAEHQVRTTVDFAPSNRLLGWYVGGLNFQVEHHLFPAVCHVHYPALSAIVADACRARGIPYVARPTLRSALAAHYRLLQSLGAPDTAAPQPVTA